MDHIIRSFSRVKIACIKCIVHAGVYGLVGACIRTIMHACAWSHACVPVELLGHL